MPFAPLPGAPAWAQRLLEIIAQALDDLDVPKPDTPDDKEATQPARDERNATDDGPGEWIHENKNSWSPRSRHYEEDNTDAPASSTYRVPTDGTDSGFVKFDDRVKGENGKRDTFVEAKGPGYDFMINDDGTIDRNWKLSRNFPKMVRNHNKAAKQHDANVEYRVATPKLKKALDREINRQGAKDRLRVVVIPPKR